MRLIVGNSATIPSYGTGGRVVLFSGGTNILQQMLTYGFSSTSEEYLAAQNFLAASSNPFYLAIGRQDATAIGAFTIDVAGTGYALGDLIYPTGISNAILKVTAESGGISKEPGQQLQAALQQQQTVLELDLKSTLRLWVKLP